MEIRPWSPSRPAALDLSKAPGFALGPLAVDPPMRLVRNGPRCETLEPRVMRVLVALAGEPGRVLSRDDLIALCWDGQIVGDNAINRVISRLRAVLLALAGDAVRLQTITKVGFRLTSDGMAPPAMPSPPLVESLSAPPLPVSRRAAIGGGLAVVFLAAAAYAGWRNASARYRPPPVALELYERGVGITKNAVPGSNRQALTFFKSAVAIDPQFADAWGALALGYTFDDQVYPQQLRSAADRALALDPDQPDANLALLIGQPFYRRWYLVEPRLRSYQKRFPDHWYGNFQMSWLLREVGRHEEAIPFIRRVVEIDPMIPIGWSSLSGALFSAGRLEESDSAVDEGMRRSPGHAELWFARYSTLMYGHRFDEAATFARDPDNRPIAFGKLVLFYANLAESLAKRDPRGIGAGHAYFRETLRTDEPGTLEAIPRFAPLLALIGARQDAVTAFEGYLFGGNLFGRDVKPPHPTDTRMTRALFSPPMLAHRDARFDRVLERAGLEDYWKRSGSQPDFRRC